MYDYQTIDISILFITIKKLQQSLKNSFDTHLSEKHKRTNLTQKICGLKKTSPFIFDNTNPTRITILYIYISYKISFFKLEYFSRNLLNMQMNI